MSEKLSKVAHSRVDIARLARGGTLRALRFVTSDVYPITFAVTAGTTGALVNSAPNSNLATLGVAATLFLVGKNLADDSERRTIDR